LEILYGLGGPVLYNANPLYGYRPLPNKVYTRFGGAKIKFNNLGLRAEEDWDSNRDDKILFLGDSVTYGGSFIDNQELFSYLALTDLKNFQGGNAGVNAWGVENIYGLVVESNFIPAKFYITTLAEQDFYRGLTRMQGLPFFNVPPKYALAELWYYFCYLQNNQRYAAWEDYVGSEERRYVVKKAVAKLNEMDEFLKRHGFQHLIFISPNRDQVFNDAPKDELVHKLLKEFNLPHIYILDELKQFEIAKKEEKYIFYDGTHLNKKGHEIWAKIIRIELDKIIH
jgi:hypothetical protein